MRRWKNTVEAAMEALGAPVQPSPSEAKEVCGFCRWWSWPGETCVCGASGRRAEYVTAFEAACGHFAAARGCATCRHYLDGGLCGAGLERECRDGGFEAWEPVGGD